MDPLTEQIQLKLPQTIKLSSTFKTEIILEAFRPRESNWTYNHTRLVHWGGNLNMKTLIYIPCIMLVIVLLDLQKIGLKWGYHPMIDWMRLFQIGALWWSGTTNMRVIPSVELSSNVGISHQWSCLLSEGIPSSKYRRNLVKGNYWGFIHL